MVIAVFSGHYTTAATRSSMASPTSSSRQAAPMAAMFLSVNQTPSSKSTRTARIARLSWTATGCKKELCIADRVEIAIRA